MNYFKLISFITFFVVLTSACFAMDAPEPDRIANRPSLHTLSSMKDIYQYVGGEEAPEPTQKRVKADDRDSDSHEEEGDLSQCLVGLDFDEALGNYVYKGRGADFARDCRAFSCEMFREDEMAFHQASKLLNITVDDYKTAKDEWCRSLMRSCEYTLLESSTKDLLMNLRKRGATLLVCSGNVNNPYRTAFLKTLGFNGKTDYFYEPDDKTRPVKEWLNKKRFSKVLFVDNRRGNVEDFVRGLAAAFTPSQSQAIEITVFTMTFFTKLLPQSYWPISIDSYKKVLRLRRKLWRKDIRNGWKKSEIRSQNDK